MNKVNAAKLFGLMMGAAVCAASADERPMNVIMIYTDDQGYNDLGCYGSEMIRTPNIDRMAAEGVRFTDFNVMSSKCTPSRAALMTGCYPRRVSLQRGVVMDGHTHGLHPDEITMGDQMKSGGYATALFGKWHLGHADRSMLPQQQGFDVFFGLPYSNDMKLSPLLELKEGFVERDHAAGGVHFQRRSGLPQGVLMEGDVVIEYPTDQSMLTQRLTKRAQSFIVDHKDQPFFIYLAHPMPHVPVDASPAFAGKSPFGPYGDAVEELDWSVGEILNTLKEEGLDKNTLVVYASDNGPWGYGKAPDAKVGLAHPLRGTKGTVFEGGPRVPCIMWAPEHLPARVYTGLVSNMDLFPTFSALAGIELADDREIDGKNIWPLLRSEVTDEDVHEHLFYYEDRHGKIAGARHGSWKYVECEVKRNGPIVPQLYNLAEDIGEQQNVLKQHPEKVRQLREAMEKFDAIMEEEARPVLRIE